MMKITTDFVRYLNIFIFAVLLGTSFNAAQAEESVSTDVRTATLAVENMTCAMCPITVKKSLTNLEGVIDADVNFDHKTEKVVYRENSVSIEQLTKATTNVGYPSVVSK